MHAPLTAAIPTAGLPRAFRHIVVCLDRSEAAEAVLPVASHFARVDGGQLTLLHVVQAPADSTEFRATDALEWEIAREESRSYLQRVAGLVADLGVKAECRVSEGAPAQGVETAAIELGTDLIVLSAIGEGGAEAYTLGSTAQKVLASARVPVLVVPTGASEAAHQVPPRRILVPLDGSVRGECVLPVATRLARASDAKLVLTHVVVDPVRTELLASEEDLALAQRLSARLEARAQLYLERIRSQMTAAGVRADTAVSRSVDHKEGLVALAITEHADLIVLSAHGAVCNPRRRFGSVASHVITHAPAPVLVIQDLPDTGSRVTTPVLPSPPPPRSFGAPLGGD